MWYFVRTLMFLFGHWFRTGTYHIYCRILNLHFAEEALILSANARNPARMSVRVAAVRKNNLSALSSTLNRDQQWLRSRITISPREMPEHLTCTTMRPVRSASAGEIFVKLLSFFRRLMHRCPFLPLNRSYICIKDHPCKVIDDLPSRQFDVRCPNVFPAVLL